MQLTVEIPDEVALALSAEGHHPARTALEAVAIEGYRSGALSPSQTRRLLGFGTRYEFDGFLKAHNVEEFAYDMQHLEQDRRSFAKMEALGLIPK